MFHVTQSFSRHAHGNPPRDANAFGCDATEFAGIAPCLQEVFIPSDAGGSGAAFALGQLGPDRPGALLWVQERAAMRSGGIPYPPGLPPLGGPLFHVLAGNARDLLFAMEEGLKCSAIAAVIGELSGDPPALDFTATRRLAVACERSGVPAFLLRHAASPNLSGARERWRVVASPSLSNPWDSKAPGPAMLDVELFRSRSRSPAQWRIAHDHDANRLGPSTPTTGTPSTGIPPDTGDTAADAGAGTVAALPSRRSGG